jgi:hypothetical protein
VSTPHWGNPIRNVSQGGGASIPFSGGDERSEPENTNYNRTAEKESSGGKPDRANARSEPSGLPMAGRRSVTGSVTIQTTRQRVRGICSQERIAKWRFV